LLDDILILLETSFVRELHSHVCHCPVELVLERDIVLHSGVLSFGLNEYLGYEGWANMTKDVLNFEIYIGLCRVDKNV